MVKISEVNDNPRNSVIHTLLHHIPEVMCVLKLGGIKMNTGTMKEVFEEENGN